MAPSPTDDADADAAAAPREILMTVDEATRLLPYLTRDQLRSAVKSALPASPPLLASLRVAADADLSLRRLHVRCISGETSPEDLVAAFSPFGPVLRAEVEEHPAMDMIGLAIVEFRHVASAVRALGNPSKRIAGRVAIAYLPLGPSPIDDAAVTSRGVIVDGVPWKMPGDRLIDYFQRFGEIEVGPAGWFDVAEEKKRSLRVVFLYKTNEGALAATAKRERRVGKRRLVCRPAWTKLLVHIAETDSSDEESDTGCKDEFCNMREKLVCWPEYSAFDTEGSMNQGMPHYF